MDRIKSLAYHTGIFILWAVMAATTVHALHGRQPPGIAGN